MDWTFPYASHRVPVLAANVVATTQPLAAQAGLSMLARGGNAVDAAIATAITLTVVEPAMNGIGSDAFAIVWDGNQLHGLNASGRSPAGWSPERFAGRDSMPVTGWDTVTVPGAVSAWVALHQKFGKLPFETLFEAAIRYARDGFMVSPRIARQWHNQIERLGGYAGFAETFLPNGRAPQPGEFFRSRPHATTLEAIAETNGEAFYRGKLAEAIAAAAAKDGGALSLDDLATHAPDWVTPIGVDFRGHRVHEIPPNGQGLAALIGLGILERFDLESMGADDEALQHLMIEATKVGMADVAAHVADPSAMRVTAEALLTPDYLDARARGIDRDRAQAPSPGKPAGHETVYLAAADSSGMMVSYIQSNFRGFGSGIVVPGTGIALHNRGASFVTKPGHPNQVGPRKRPLNTIIPGFITRDGKPVAAFGVMGGEMQPQGHIQVAMRLLAKNQNPQAAIDAPRWRIGVSDVAIEAEWPDSVKAALAARGHKLTDANPLDLGAAQIIWRQTNGGYVAGSESRRDGQAVGF